MAAPKGHPRYGGREKGTPNRATQDVRTAIAKLAQNCAGEVEQWLREIEDPAKRVDCYARLIEYHIPKLGRTEHDVGPGVTKVMLTIG